MEENMANASESLYLEILKKILNDGTLCKNRTGIDTLAIPHVGIQHDMSQGFPLLTTKKMHFNSIKVELEFFIKGLHDKQWLKDRKCNIWNEWCSPSLIPQGLSEEARKEYQLRENELGPIYGVQWRNFNNQGYDQFKKIVDALRDNPDDRRMVCSAWNPLQLDSMALPPCHFVWVVTKIGNKIHLSFHMRSVDTFLGLPFNIASYGLLLHLLSKQSGLEAGILTGYLDNVHIYVNHIDAVRKQIEREPYEFPTIETNDFTDIFNWSYCDSVVKNYNSHEAIRVQVAV